MTGATDWQTRVGDVWATEWRRTDRSFADLSRHLNAAILAAAPDSGSILDIGCGAGGTSLALATARPDLAITGVDLSPALIAVAQSRAAEAGLVPGPSFIVAAADELAPTPAYDLLVSRHGVMFFADPVAAFTRLRQVARPGARLVFSCFGPRAENRFATLTEDLAGMPPTIPNGYQPGPFAFADPRTVTAILTEAGWITDAAARVAFDYRAGQGDDPVADAAAFLSRIGPVSLLLRDADPADRPRLLAALAEHLDFHRHEDTVDLPGAAWIWRAHAGAPA
jgi:SAM-dependent methyltransferase